MKSLEDLQKMCDEEAKRLKLRIENNYQYTIIVSSSTHALMKGSRDTINTIIEALATTDQVVKVMQDGHIEPSDADPIVEVYDQKNQKTTYQQVDVDRAKEIVERHIIHGEIIEDYVLK